MGLFSRRRRYGSRRKKRVPTIWDNLVWAVEPDTAREIIAVVLIIFGALFALGLFHLAGNFGEVFFKLAGNLFGVLKFVVPFVFLYTGIRLLIVKSEVLRATSVIGVVLLFLLIPALFNAQGGSIGIGVANVFTSILSKVGGFIALFGATIVALLLAFNVSLRSLYERFQFGGKEGQGVKINENPRVPVRTMKPERGGMGTALVAGSENWQFPSLDLIDYSSSTKAEAGDIGKNVEVIKKTLKDFGVEVAMSEVNVGPTLTQYTLKPSEGVKLNTITARSNDIALALAAHPIRVEAPIPGKSLVGIEVPNKVAAMVSLREVLEAPEYKDVTSNLALALGRDVAGKVMVADLKKMPHLLIAGATGSGKSVCMNAILVNLLYKNAPSDLRLILIDPKRVEFVEYNGIPHLLTSVVTETDKIISTLRWAVAEMERRYQTLASHNKRNIDAFNEAIPDGEQKMPYIVIVIDELADLMTQAANEVEASVVRIAQMARAVGMHLIVATQRPSVDVITGLIKANIPARIAFAVASMPDSRTILDQGGADKLLGRGDMLYLNSDQPQPRRAQGVFLKDKEIKAVTDWVKSQAPPVYDDTITTYRSAGHGSHSGLGTGGDHDGGGDDELFNDARDLCIQAGKASASLLQRRLKVGYARAARLLDLLEAEGIIGPADGAKPRDVLVAPDDYQGS
ncbi:MAG TPA: DNA translocase FtsK 4TM domain-containing protein [Candidatus Saccharimonadales bacterium]|nr:DNA translocase FtsK 4TM domain-containing protein [Candidatus Saccharimonadales bacterium]